MLLLIDNYDSFTYNLAEALYRCGMSCEVRRNDEITIAEIDAMEIDGIVLSPGPKTPSEAGIMPQVIETYHRQKPILGVCLGHQGIGVFFGAKLVQAPVPVHGHTTKLLFSDHPLFDGIESPLEAMCYHSLILEDINEDVLEVTARNEDGHVMAIQHKQYPLTGFQFHPESILTKAGNQLLYNWLQFAIYQPSKLAR